MKLTMKLYWLWNRLKCMSVPELSYRIFQKVSSKIQQYGFFIANNPPQPVLSGPNKKWLSILNNVDAKYYAKMADNILNGCMRIFSLTYRFDDTPADKK